MSLHNPEKPTLQLASGPWGPRDTQASLDDWDMGDDGREITSRKGAAIMMLAALLGLTLFAAIGVTAAALYFKG